MPATTVEPPVATPKITTKVKDKIKLSPRWSIVFHNDDVTPIDAVILTIIEVFYYDKEKAFEITKNIEKNGCDAVAIGSLELMELRFQQCEEVKKKFGATELNISLEPVDS